MNASPKGSSFDGLPLSFENAAGRLYEHPAGYLVLCYGPGKRHLTSFQALLTHTSHLLRRNGWRRVLTDQRLMTPFTDEERTWAQAFWSDTANLPAGGLWVAVVLANDVFARLATSVLKQVIQSAVLTYRVFDTEAEATAWLQRG